jgi:hypothetical protein
MKKTQLKNLYAILFIILISAVYASAQTVEIKNYSGEKRKICMYKADDKVGLVPFRCFEMNDDEKVLWNRMGDTSYFTAKIF